MSVAVRSSTPPTAVRRPTPTATVGETRPSGAVWVWALIGVVTLALLLKAWGGWLLDPDTAQPDPGADHYDHMLVLRATEAISFAVFAGLGWWSLIRPLRQGRGLILDGKLFLAGFFVSSLDILYASLNPTWAMNAHAVSLGTWSEQMPGFANPGQDQNAWGLMWCLPAYIWLGLGAAMVGTAILDRLRERFARLSTVASYAIVVATFYVVFALIENVWLRTQVYTYVSVPSDLTVWSGKTYQWPVYSPLFIGFYCLGYTWLRDSRDDRGRCAVDRDVDRVAAGPRAKQAVSLLAVTGAAAAITIGGYQIPWSVMSMRGNEFPTLPSYLQPGQNCGQPGTPLCVSQYLHRLRDQPDRLPRIAPAER